MLVQSVGEKLRQARVRKGLHVTDLELLTGIDSHFILVIELDQFELLSVEQYRSYLTTCATAVDLDPEELLLQFDKERISPSFNDYDYEANYSDVEKSNLLTGSSRVSRYHRRQSKKGFRPFSPLFISCLLLLFVFMLLRFLDNGSLMSKNPKVSTEKVTNVSRTKEEQLAPVKERPKASLLVEGEGNYLTVTVKTDHYPVTVGFNLLGTDGSWIALTNSDLGDGGLLLGSENPSYQTSLWEGTTNAFLSLGVSQAVAVTVNDVPLELPETVPADVIYLNLVIVPETIVTPEQPNT